MNNQIKISILVPAYNESQNLPVLIKQISKNFENSHHKNVYEIIIINDGSTDNTVNVALNLYKKYQYLRVINLKENYGKAHALDMGIQNAKGSIIATIDADLQYSAKNLLAMTDLIFKGNDLINGKRNIRKDNFITIFFYKIYNFIIRIFFGIKLEDFFSGIKVYRKDIYELMDYSGMARFIVFYSKKYNFKISELKVDHFNRQFGKTSYKFHDRIILSIKDIFSLIFCVYLGKKGFYNLKQIIFSFYFLIFLCMLVINFFNEKIVNKYLLLTFVSLIIFIIFNFIVSSFLDSKSNKKENLIKNILN